MPQNITLKLDENILKLCRYEAVEAEKSLSQWVADVLTAHVRGLDDYAQSKERAKERMRQGFHLGGSPDERDASHERS